jgi:hypothetical protein
MAFGKARASVRYNGTIHDLMRLNALRDAPGRRVPPLLAILDRHI